MKTYLAVMALLGNFSKATLLAELNNNDEIADQDPPCKNELCGKYMRQINSKNERWVDDHNDSISTAEAKTDANTDTEEQ